MPQDPKKAKRRILEGSLLNGAGVCATGMFIGGVLPKDVFQYKNLAKNKQKSLKITGVITLLVTLFTFFDLKKEAKNKQKQAEYIKSKINNF